MNSSLNPAEVYLLSYHSSIFDQFDYLSENSLYNIVYKLGSYLTTKDFMD
jgi:hypothetical protein